MAQLQIGARIAVATLALLPVAAASPQAPSPAVLALDKPLYQAGENATLTVTGTPGDAFWLLFEKHSGPTTIPGLGTFGLLMGAGLDAYPMGTIPTSGVFTASCAPDCGSEAAAGPTFIQAVTYDTSSPIPLAMSNTVVFDVLRGDECHPCPVTPAKDPIFGVTAGGTAVYLFGIGDDFVFEPGASYAEYADGTARLTGEIYRVTVPTERFLLDTLFTNHVGPGNLGYPPPGSPKKELLPGAYNDMGGPIDPGTWRYYEGFNGLLIGLGDFAGGAVSISRSGPAFQVGVGANNKNLNYGASGWLIVSVLTQPTGTTLAPIGGGDFNFDLGDCPPIDERCAFAAVTDSYSPQVGDAPHAVIAQGIGERYLFQAGGGKFTEFPGGTARLTGELVNPVDATKRWNIDVFFSTKVSPGDLSYPPLGSPMLELRPTAYLSGGGPVDPSTWYYYEDFIGTMTGLDTYAGASLLVTRRGPAFQVGVGASGKNIKYGGSGWTNFDVVSQPSVGPALPVTTIGDINIDIDPCVPAP